MQNQNSKQRILQWGAIALSIVLLVIFFLWMELVAPHIKTYLETAMGRDIFSFPTPLAIAIAVCIIFIPPFGLAAGIYAFAYFRWFIPNRTRLAREELSKLIAVRRALSDAVRNVATYESEIGKMSAEANEMRQLLSSLKILNSENSKELEQKLKAMDSLTQNRIWFERTFAFVIGIASSTVASYLWLAIQPR